MKAKVIELVGVKLGPKAKYLIMIDEHRAGYINRLDRALHHLIGDNFVIGLTHGDPNEVVKVYEFVKEKK